MFPLYYIIYMEREYLQKLVNEDKSIADIVEETGFAYTTVRYWLNKHSLKTNYKPYKFQQENLTKLVAESVSFNEVLKKLGRNHSGGTWLLLKRKVKEFGIDTSHFLGKSACAGARNPGKAKKKSHTEILVEGHSERVRSRILRRALIESGREYRCEECKLIEWRGEKLTLDIDHIDGNWSDCRPSNLKFVCPNCHRLKSQKEWDGS